jgi:hypothetical protein
MPSRSMRCTWASGTELPSSQSSMRKMLISDYLFVFNPIV